MGGDELLLQNSSTVLPPLEALYHSAVARLLVHLETRSLCPILLVFVEVILLSNVCIAMITDKTPLFLVWVGRRRVRLCLWRFFSLIDHLKS